MVDGEENCSGSLINTKHSDMKPYFLTALHCVTGHSTSGLVFRFKYEAGTPKCPGNSTGTKGTWITFSGSTLRASVANTDMALLELSAPIVGIPNLAVAGWSRSTTGATSGAGIHHPAGDAKKISTYTVDAIAVDVNVLGIGNVLSWEIEWDNGITEGGSSGSPLFDQNKRIVGHLSGDNIANCANPDGSSFYGRFNNSFTGNGTTSGSLEPWLAKIYPPSAPTAAPQTVNSVRVPSISSYENVTYICTSNKTISLLNPIPGRSTTWSVSPTSLFGSSTSGSGTSATLKAASSSSSGSATLTFTLSQSNSPNVVVTRSIYVGKPKLISAKVNGSTSSGYNVVYPLANLTVEVSGTASYSWSRASGSGNTYPNGAACLAYHIGFATVNVSSTNTCGTTDLYNFVLDDPSISPKVDDDITITSFSADGLFIDVSELPEDELLKSIKVFDASSRLLHQINNNDFSGNHLIHLDVSGSPSGVYFVSFELEHRIITKKITRF